MSTGPRFPFSKDDGGGDAVPTQSPTPAAPVDGPRTYGKRGPKFKTEARTIEMSKPAVAELVARLVFVHLGDYEAAFRKLLPEESSYRVNILAKEAENNAAVQMALQELLKKAGLGDDATNQLAQELWRWIFGEDKDLKQTGARILGRALLGERKREEHVESLRVEGLEEGIQRLLQEGAETQKTGGASIGNKEGKDNASV